MEFFGRQTRESFPQVVATLATEYGKRSGASAIGPFLPVFQNIAQQVVVLFHAPYQATDCHGSASGKRAESAVVRDKLHRLAFAGPLRYGFSRMTNQQPPVPDAARRYSAPAFLHTLGRVSRFASEKVLTSALVLYHCLRDKDTPVWAKGVITGALGYLILPTDLVPDLLPGAGYGDDWGRLWQR